MPGGVPATSTYTAASPTRIGTRRRVEGSLSPVPLPVPKPISSFMTPFLPLALVTSGLAWPSQSSIASESRAARLSCYSPDLSSEPDLRWFRSALSASSTILIGSVGVGLASKRAETNGPSFLSFDFYLQNANF